MVSLEVNLDFSVICHVIITVLAIEAFLINFDSFSCRAIRSSEQFLKILKSS